MPVSNTNTFTASTANGVTTVFPYNFTLLSAGDLVVTVAGVVVTTGFTVSGVGDAAGGNVTFAAAPANLARVLLRRVVTLTRSTDYQYVGSLASATLDADFDRLWLAMQQVNTSIGLVPALPVGSPYTGSLKLPEPTANGFWRWNSAASAVEWIQLDLESAGAAVLKADLANATDPAKGSALVGFLQAGTGAVARTAQDKARDIVSVKDFGAKGDGTTDDTSSIQLAINTVGAAGGGTIYFPRGTYRVTSQLNISYPGINLCGTGRSGVYPGGYSASDPRGSLILATAAHSGPNVLRFFSNTINSLSGFSCCDMGFAVDRSAPEPSLDCFGWDMGHFQYDFIFNRVSVHLFNIGFHLYKTGSLTDQAAALKIRDSNINHNNLIAKTTGSNTAWNGFEMVGCNAGQQQVGGVDIKATGCVIHNNILEGQPNPIKINGINSPTSIKNNYFEQTTGNANIHINTSRGAVDIGPNYHYNSGSTKVTHRVLLDDCAFVRCVDPYWSCKTYKCSPLPQVKKGDEVHGMGDTSSVYTSTQRFFRADDPNTIMGVSEISPNSVVVLQQGRRELSPINHEPMQCRNFSTGGTTETNVIATSFSGTTVSAGKWIVVSWLLKYDHALNPAHQPYISWPAGVLDGSQDTVLGQFNQVANIGEFYVFTAAYRCATAISSASLQMNFYPYGVSNPAIGNTCAFGGVTMSIVDSVEDIKPYVSPMAMRGATAVPTAGTWKVGDTLLNVAPAAGGTIGWVCTTAGTPGTWKAFGNIAT